MTTSFGNATIPEQCYTISNAFLDGLTCESPTASFSVPILQSTIVSDIESMSSTVKSRIINALAELTTDSASTFSSGMQKRWINDTVLEGQHATLDERQLGSVGISNFVSQNFAPVTGAASTVSFDLSVPALGVATHCGITRDPGQGSGATGTFQTCDNPAVSYNWTSPLSMDTQVTVPNVISG